jgi:UDP-N-acetylglucosamine 2-epimerase (non-hydrolysing)
VVRKKPFLLFILGTRPEAIKLAPLIIQARRRGLKTYVALTNQHPKLALAALHLFDVQPDFRFPRFSSKNLEEAGAEMMKRTGILIRKLKPDYVVVQGDTLSAAMGALGCFYSCTRLIHVEAGLRTFQMSSPWPEEFQRRLIGLCAHLHFAPSRLARANLLRSDVPQADIFVMGNTGIDALNAGLEKIRKNKGLREKIDLKFHKLNMKKKLVVVTIHRRENLGERLEICLRSLKTLALHQEAEILFVIHPNPQVYRGVRKVFKNLPHRCPQKVFKADGVWFTPALGYIEFLRLMQRSYFILTDSGGLQEEAPFLGKPCLVLRDETERKEPLQTGSSLLVKIESQAILRQAHKMLQNPLQAKMSRVYRHYGKGRASKLILNAILKRFNEIEQG